MDTKEVRYRYNWRLLMAGLLSGMLLAAPMAVQAQTVSVTPANGASGVSTTSQVVFSFSDAMNTDEFATTISILSITPFGMPDYTVTWTSDGKTATARPTTSWPADALMMWNVSGETADTGDAVDDQGTFQTGSGSSGGGNNGTNAVTSLLLMVHHYYLQTNVNIPVVDSDDGYIFTAQTSLASNRPATGVSLALPTSQSVQLTNMIFVPRENFFVFDPMDNLTVLNQRYPGGSYNFSITSTPPLNVAVTLQPANQQPPAPHISNYAAAQSVVATQSFTLTWDAWTGGTAQDYIFVSVGTNWHSPYDTQTGALRGNATSVTIPANALQPNTTNSASIQFMRTSVSSNAAQVYVTSAARATTTEFTFVTTSGVAPTAPRLANATQVGSDKFGFSVIAPAGQSLTLQGSETLLSNSWTTVYTTNAASGTTLIVLPKDPTGKRFYRLRSP